MSKFVSMNELRDRYGGIGRTTVYRWVSNPNINFPKPRKIGHRIMWSESALDAFDAQASQD